MQNRNKKNLENFIGMKWKSFLGYSGQKSFNRVTEYTAFCFDEDEVLRRNEWKEDKHYKKHYVPNKRTSKGRKIADFMSKSMEGHSYTNIYDLLGLEHPSGRFQLPFLENYDGVIVLSLDELITNDPDIIEITTKEAIEIYESCKNKEIT